MLFSLKTVKSKGINADGVQTLISRLAWTDKIRFRGAPAVPVAAVFSCSSDRVAMGSRYGKRTRERKNFYSKFCLSSSTFQLDKDGRN